MTVTRALTCVTPLHPPPRSCRYPVLTESTLYIGGAVNPTVAQNTSSMTTPVRESETPSDVVHDELMVDYESDTVSEVEDLPDSSPSERPVAPYPCPFPERSVHNTQTALRAAPPQERGIFQNSLDEQQQRVLYHEHDVRQRAAAKALAEHRKGYVFREQTFEERLREIPGMSFATWTIRPSASTAEEVAERDALRARYLTPHVTTVREYQDRLNSYARRQSVPALKEVPIVLHPGEDIEEDDRMFIRWAHRARRLSSMDALRASAAVVNVRLERKLRFDFAKLKARG